MSHRNCFARPAHRNRFAGSADRNRFAHPTHQHCLAWAAAALGFLVLTLSPVQAQQTAPPRQEHGNLIFEGIPPRSADLAERLHQYRQSREARFLDWLPNGAMLIATRFGDSEQVHRLAGPLSAREQLTFYLEPVKAARAPRTGAADSFVFLKSEPGVDGAQLYLYSSSAHVQQLTHGKFAHGSPVWSNDGKRVAFYGTERDSVSYDVYVLDIGSASAPRLIAGGQQDTWYPLDWSADDRKLLLLKYGSGSESALYIADVYTGTLTPVDESNRKYSVTGARFAPDGRGIYLVSDEEGDFSQLRYIDPISHDVRKVTAQLPWDIESFDVSVDGRYIAYVANQDGHSRLTITDTIRKLEQSPPGLPDGVIGDLRFDRTGRRLALSAESATLPRDVYVYDLGKNALERWTRSELGPLDPGALVPGETVHYPTWDRLNGSQRTLSAVLYRPKSSGPHPVVIAIHGGPDAQYRAGWDPFIQFLVNELGYAVVAPNVRGSSGYGKAFARLDDTYLREDSVKDIGSLIVWIGLQPMFDREHVVVMGDAYGGYMALAALAAYGDRLKGGIDDVGITNFVTFLEGTVPHERELQRAEFGDERDPKARAFLSRISPFNNIASIRKPLLVMAATSDGGAVASEAQNIAWRVRSKGVEVWYLAARDESRALRKRANQDAFLETEAMFLERLAKH